MIIQGNHSRKICYTNCDVVIVATCLHNVRFKQIFKLFTSIYVFYKDINEFEKKGCHKYLIKPIKENLIIN